MSNQIYQSKNGTKYHLNYFWLWSTIFYEGRIGIIIIYLFGTSAGCFGCLFLLFLSSGRPSICRSILVIWKITLLSFSRFSWMMLILVSPALSAHAAPGFLPHLSLRPAFCLKGGFCISPQDLYYARPSTLFSPIGFLDSEGSDRPIEIWTDMLLLLGVDQRRICSARVAVSRALKIF